MINCIAEARFGTPLTMIAETGTLEVSNLGSGGWGEELDVTRKRVRNDVSAAAPQTEPPVGLTVTLDHVFTSAEAEPKSKLGFTAPLPIEPLQVRSVRNHQPALRSEYGVQFGVVNLERLLLDWREQDQIAGGLVVPRQVGKGRKRPERGLAGGAGGVFNTSTQRTRVPPHA